MTEFTISLAGIAVGASVRFESTKAFCRDYLTETAPRFSVETTAEDVALERRKSEEDDRRMGVSVRHFSDAYLETLALYRQIAERLPAYDTALIHGAVVEMDGTAYLFTAPSGTGKTTHIRLWKECFGDKVRVLNGDKPLLSLRKDGIWACGTPWQGKENEGENRMARLGGLCALHRAAENSIAASPAAEMMPVLLRQFYRPADAAMRAKTFQLIGAICAGTPCYSLGCNMDRSAAETARQGMNRNG